MFYPDFRFPPVNLWALPRQYRDYEMQQKRNIKADNRARSLMLNPPPRPKKASQVIIEPALGEVHNYDVTHAMHCKLLGERSRG